VEAIRNLKIDKITVWDSGSADGKGSSTANFASSLIKSLPPLHDIASMAGVELPGYLGKMTRDGDKEMEFDVDDDVRPTPPPAPIPPKPAPIPPLR
jgi:flotillin